MLHEQVLSTAVLSHLAHRHLLDELPGFTAKKFTAFGSGAIDLYAYDIIIDKLTLECSGYEGSLVDVASILSRTSCSTSSSPFTGLAPWIFEAPLALQK